MIFLCIGHISYKKPKIKIIVGGGRFARLIELIELIELIWQENIINIIFTKSSKKRLDFI